MWLSADSQHTGLTSGGVRAFFAPQPVSSSQSGDQICVPCTSRQILNHWTAREGLHLRILNPQKRRQRIHKRVMKIHQSIPLTWALTSSGHKDDEELKPWYLHGQQEFRLWVTLHGAVLKMKLDPQPSPVCSQLSALELKARHRCPCRPRS